MKHGDSYDTFSGTALTYGDGTRRYRALRVDRTDLASRHPGARAVRTGNGSVDLSSYNGADELRVAEVLSRPDLVEHQVFVIEVEDEAEFIAFAERGKVVVYPLEDASLELTDWGDPNHREHIQDLLDAIPFESELHDGHDGDAQRRTAADREQSGKHAHQPARRQRVGGRWVG